MDRNILIPIDTNKCKTKEGKFQKFPHNVKSGSSPFKNSPFPHVALNLHQTKNPPEEIWQGTKNESQAPEQYLNKNMLRQLQKELLALEDKEFGCEHLLCDVSNRLKLHDYRLWFLFELEMSYSGVENLRYQCYYKEVYQKLDPSWKLKNTFMKKQDEAEGKSFLWQQLIVPDISFVSQTMEMKDKICTEERYNGPFRPVIKMPHTVLSSRNKKHIFDEQRYISQSVFQKIAPVEDDRENRVEKCCILEKRISKKVLI